MEKLEAPVITQVEISLLERDLLTEKRRATCYALLAFVGWAIILIGAFAK